MSRYLQAVLPYRLRIEARRGIRGVRNLFSWPKAARRAADPEVYPELLVQHSSKLLRQVPPHLTHLQHNKVQNLRLACAKIDGVLLKPGDLFSFCSLVGRTTYRRGYVDGLEMHRGELMGSPGGGLCQLSNLIYWLAVNLDLEIIERHRHELDLFPDDERIVPFGMGASVFYNYHDLRFRNRLSQPLLLRISVCEPLLMGAFYSDREKGFEVQIAETLHRFFRRGDGQVWRENRVTCSVLSRSGQVVKMQEIAHNLGRVCYEVPNDVISSSVSD